MAMPPSATSPAAPSSLLNNENINQAILRLETNVAQEMKNPASAVSRDIDLLFGSARAAAAEKIVTTISLLRAYCGATTLGSLGPGMARYVQDDSLPAECRPWASSAAH